MPCDVVLQAGILLTIRPGGNCYQRIQGITLNLWEIYFPETLVN
jgi:hypothetical protein